MIGVGWLCKISQHVCEADIVNHTDKDVDDKFEAHACNGKFIVITRLLPHPTVITVRN